MLTIAMLIFGSIGLFVRYIPLPSSVIAFVRAFIGVIFLVMIITLRKAKLDQKALKRNFIILLLSGCAIGFNWILLFESYRYTSVAVSTLCYYMAPVIVTLLAPLVLKESISFKRISCAIIAVVGVALISGLLGGSTLSAEENKGILFGLGAASLYASAILLNKRLRQIEAMDRTIFQLLIAAIVLLVYNVLSYDLKSIAWQPSVAILLLVVGIVHTGLAYYLYFGSMVHLSGQTIAIISYIDPVIAVMISVVLLREPFNIYTVIGAVAILGAAALSELPHKEEMNNDN